MTNGPALSLPADEGGSQHLHGILIVGAGVLVLSFDAVLIRLAHTDGWTVAFWRGAFMFVSLGGLLAVRGGWGATFASIRAGGTLALISIIGFGTTSLLFVLSIMLTKAANTVVIVSAAPLFAALFTRVFLSEVVDLRTWLAILASVAGVVAVFYGSLGGGSLAGDLCALATARMVPRSPATA